MRPRVANSRDTLNVRRLPPDPRTYLDYRTSINSPEFDTWTTLRLIVVSSIVLLPLAISGRLIASMADGLSLICGAIGVALLASGALRTAFYGKLSRHLSWGGVLFVAALVAELMARFPSPRSAFLGLFTSSLLLAASTAYLIVKQAAFWMTANHRIDQQTMFRWRRIWSFNSEPDGNPLCPEILTIPIMLIATIVGILAGFVVLHFFFADAPQVLSGVFAIGTTLLIIMLALPFAHSLVGATLPPPSALVAGAWHGLRIFACYNRHATPAPGVFRFPTKWCQSVVARDFLLGTTLSAVAFAFVAVLLPPPPRLSLAAIWRIPERRPIVLEDHEWDTFRSLPYDQGMQFLNRLTSEKRTAILTDMDRAARARQRERVFPRVVIVLVVSAFAPSAVLLLLIACIGGSTLHRYYVSLEQPNALLHTSRTSWDSLVDRLINSPNAIEANHLFLGTSLHNDYPILLDQEILTDHGHILGDTGAYKTSMGLAPMATQLIAGGKCSVLLIDLKGEPALFHGLREEAARAGLPFKWFTTTPDWTSYCFNPFLQKHWRKFTIGQRVQVTLTALSLDYGIDYGRAFFTAMNETVLSSVLRGAPMESFEDLYRFLCNKEVYRAFGNVLDWEKARHLVVMVDRLRSVHPLNVTPSTLPNRSAVFQNAIELADLLNQPQVVYFYLPAPREPLGTSSIARLVIHSLFTAAADGIPASDKVRTYTMIDEFQQVISNSVERVLEQGRSLGTSYILSHQTKGQSKRGGIDITETVESCTAFKQNYRASDLRTIQELEQLSGQGVFHRFAWSQTAPASDDDEDDVAPRFSSTGEVMVTETIGPLLERNTILEVSADRQGCIVRSTKDSNYTRFGGKATPILCDFHIHRSDFQSRERREWPEETVDTIVVEPDLGNTYTVRAASNPTNPLSSDSIDPDDRLSDLR